MSEISKIRVLLVDDHPFVLQGIRACLSVRERFEVVGEATNGQEAIRLATELSPSVIIMDISMPGMNGLEATRHLRKSAADSKVLILSVHDHEAYTSEIFRAGAHGYVNKNMHPSELVQAIEALHRGEYFFGPNFTQKLLQERIQAGPHSDRAKSGQLSVREREVLTLIAEGHSNKQTANVLGLSVRTVEKHRERIMEKLHLHSVVELTKYAISERMVEIPR